MVKKIRTLVVSRVSSGTLWDNESVPFIYLFIYLGLFRAALAAYGRFQARGQIGAVAAGLCHSHSNMGSKLCLPPTPQLMVVPDP